ncbi:MAG TPA: rhodanese-like domain-containing protein [Thermodesulfobacteriota bacterium]
MFEEVSAAEALRRLAGPEPPLLLDVRAEEEFRARHAPGAYLIPLDQLPARVGELDAARPTLVVCEHGMRSLVACQFLVARAGFAHVANVRGGMSAWPL